VRTGAIIHGPDGAGVDRLKKVAATDLYQVQINRLSRMQLERRIKGVESKGTDRRIIKARVALTECRTDATSQGNKTNNEIQCDSIDVRAVAIPHPEYASSSQNLTDIQRRRGCVKQLLRNPTVKPHS
jgi:hypothetical protein